MSAQQDATPTIIVGVDGSDMSVNALKWALAHAARIEGKVIAVTGYVVPPTIWVVPTYTDADYARDAQKALDMSVDAVPPSTRLAPLEARLMQRRPAHALTETAAAEQAQLLVVGSHGHGEIPGMHLGSVATYCVHHAPCPVLVFRDSTHGR